MNTPTKLFILGIILCFSFQSCDKKDLEVQPRTSSLWGEPKHTSIAEAIWKYRYVDRHLRTGIPVLYQDLVLTADRDSRIFALDRFDGREVWAQNEQQELESHYFSDRIFLFNNVATLNSRGDHYAFNISDGGLLWEVSNPGGHAYPTNYENRILGSMRFSPECDDSDDTRDQNTFEDIKYFYSIDAYSGQQKIIYEQSKYNAYEVGLVPPTIVPLDNGEEVMIFQNRQFSTFGSPFGYREKVDLYAYNLTQDTLIWMLDSITPSGNSSIVNPIIVDEGHIYFSGEQVLLCIDFQTGETLWTNERGGGLWEIKLYQDKIIRIGEALVAWDKYTGEEIYRTNYDGGLGKLTIAGERAYWASIYLYVADLETGEILHVLQSPAGREADFRSGIAVDLESKLLYTADEHFMYGIRLPE